MFSLTGLPIVKVAIRSALPLGLSKNFDSERRTISDWQKG